MLEKRSMKYIQASPLEAQATLMSHGKPPSAVRARACACVCTRNYQQHLSLLEKGKDSRRLDLILFLSPPHPRFLFRGTWSPNLRTSSREFPRQVSFPRHQRSESGAKRVKNRFTVSRYLGLCRLTNSLASKFFPLAD